MGKETSSRLPPRRRGLVGHRGMDHTSAERLSLFTVHWPTRVGLQPVILVTRRYLD